MGNYNSVSLLFCLAAAEKKFQTVITSCNLLLSSIFPPKLTSRYMEGQTKTLAHKTAQKFSFPLLFHFICFLDFCCQSRSWLHDMNHVFFLFRPVISSSLLMVPPSLPSHPVFVTGTLYRLSRGGHLSWEEHNRTDWGRQKDKKERKILTRNTFHEKITAYVTGSVCCEVLYSSLVDAT